MAGYLRDEKKCIVPGCCELGSLRRPVMLEMIDDLGTSSGSRYVQILIMVKAIIKIKNQKEPLLAYNQKECLRADATSKST